MDTGFTGRWGWFLSATQVAALEHITLNQVYDLSTINFLNDMAFLKDKARFELEQQKKWQQKRKGSGS